MRKLFAIFAVLLFSSVAFAGPQNTSTSTGTNIIDRARVYLDEPSTNPVKWSNTDLLRFLNDGMIDVVAKTNCYQIEESITLSMDTVEYTPTASYISVMTAVYNPSTGIDTGLVKGNVSSQGRATDDTTPSYWYEYGGKIGFYPALHVACSSSSDCESGQTCTSSLCAGTSANKVNVYLIKYPAPIAAAGTVLLPAVFDKALVYYITAQAFLKDKRVNEANNYLNLYQAELDRYRGDFMEVDNETTEPIR